MSWYGLKKTYCGDIECLSPRGPASIKVIHRRGSRLTAGRDGSPSQMMVLSMASSHTSASVGVRCLGCFVGVAGGQTERRALKAKGKGGVGWGGRGRSYAGTQGVRRASPRATCRHLHLEGSILWHKQLRAPPEDRLYWFRRGVNRRYWYFWYSPLSLNNSETKL